MTADRLARIGVDARGLAGVRTGIENAAWYTLEHLTPFLGDMRLLLYDHRAAGPAPPAGLPGRYRSCPALARRLPGPLWLQAVLPLLLRADDVDLFHSWYQALPWPGSTPKTVTIHDMVPFLWGWTQTPLQRWLNRLQFRMAIRRARAILVSSGATRRDLRARFQVDESRVHTVPLGVHARFRRIAHPDRLEALRRRLSLPERFALYVGTLEPRKNLPALVRAWRIVADRTGGSLPLLLAGRKGWLFDELFRTIEELDLGDLVRHVGRVAEDDLVPLYNLAELFVYPSLYEGFGLPVLEAMSCGVPVVTSTASALAEVAGGAARLVEPRSPEAIAEAVVELHGDSELRARYAELGAGRACEFTWERCAGQTWQVWQSVARGGPDAPKL